MLDVRQRGTPFPWMLLVGWLGGLGGLVGWVGWVGWVWFGLGFGFGLVAWLSDSQQ